MQVPKERTREITPDLTEIKIAVDAETLALIEEAKTLFGCTNQAETFKRTLKVAIAQKRKVLGLTTEKHSSSTPAAGVENTSRYIPIALRRVTWRRAGARCEFVGPSGRCTSKHKLQIDHYVPLALGGKTTPENLRILCRNHNLAEARFRGLTWKAKQPKRPAQRVDVSSTNLNLTSPRTVRS